MLVWRMQITIPGPLGNSALSIVEALPNLRNLNGVPVARILEEEKEVLDSGLKPRLPIWSPEEPLVDRVMRAMWQYLLTYRLADEEKLDETPIWLVS
jgi:tubulin--tyrosine ligase-like protein 12